MRVSGAWPPRRRPQRYAIPTPEGALISAQQPAPDDLTDDDDAAERVSAVTSQISTDMVRLYKTLFGRGPKRARTNFAGPDTIIVTLEDSLTPAERTMVELGELQRLRDVRLLFQYAREDDFREVVERRTGRRVRAFISGLDAARDVACEVFYLER
jgi:uncharacterized protein YbcI